MIRQSLKGDKMRTFKTALIAIVLCFGFLAASSYGADVAKIGVIDFQKILETSNSGKLARDKINEHGRKMEVDLKKKGEKIEESKKKLEREALVMSNEMRAEREREIRISINDFKSLQKKYMADFKEQEKELVTRIQKELLKIVAKMGKKEGFLLILEKRESGIIYSPDTIDISDRVIQEYNAVVAQKTVKKDKTNKKQ
jgi:outer membrane protein